MVGYLLWALVETVLIEEALLCLFFRCRELWPVVLLNNLLTNPLLNLTLLVCGVLVLPEGMLWTEWRYHLAGELLLEGTVVLVEGGLLHYFSSFGIRKALWMSLVLNLASYLIGK